MAGREVIRSVPRKPVVVAVPQLHVNPPRQVFRQVTLTIPEAVALYAEHLAQTSGQSVEQVLAEQVVDGLDGKLVERSRGTAGSCPDGRRHQRGTINVRHCALCGVRMP